MEQKKVASRGMAVLLSAALVPTIGVPAAAFADEVEGAAASPLAVGEGSNGALGFDGAPNTLSASDGSFADSSQDAEEDVVEIDGVAYPSFESAIKEAHDGAVLKVLCDVTYSDRITIADKNLTVDLNGCTLTSDRFGFAVEDGSLTLDDTSASKSGVLKIVEGEKTEVGVVVNEGGSFTMKGGTIDSVQYGVFANPVNKNKVVIEGGHIKGKWGIAASGNKTPGCTEIVVEDGVVEGTDAGISINGSDTNGGVKIAVSDGEIKATGENSTGMYLPGLDNDTSITGGTITGATGIEVRAGTVSVSGDAVISGTGAFSANPNGSGGTTTGCGIAVAQHTTKRPIDLSISGDVRIDGHYAFYEWNAQNNAPDDLAKIKLSIAGGTFKSTGEGVTSDISSADCKEFVSGGIFGKEVPAEYCAPGYQPKQNADGTFGVVSNEVAEVDGITYSTLEEAIEKASDGSTVKVLQDVELAKGNKIVIKGKSLTFDLNGRTMSTAADFEGGAIDIGGKGTDDERCKIDIVDSSAEKNGAINLSTAAKGAGIALRINSEMTISDVSISWNRTTSGNSPAIQNQGVLTLGEGVEISSNKSGVTVIGSGAKLVIDDGASIVADSQQAVSGNGAEGYGGTAIEVNGGYLEAKQAAAIYHPQDGILTLNGGTIVGETGVQMCAGDLIIPENSAVSVEGVGEDMRIDKDGDGDVPDGSAVSFVNRGYPGGIPSGDIKGGEFVSERNDSVLAYTWARDGEGAGKEKPVDWPEARDSIAITGGSFSSDPSEYVADGYDVSESGGMWTVSKHSAPVTPPSRPDVDVEVEHNADGSTTTTETEASTDAAGNRTEVKTETTEGRPDGSTGVKVTETVTAPDGSTSVKVTETNTLANGTSAAVESDGEGNVSKVEAVVPAGAAAEGPAKLPMAPLPAAPDAEAAPEVSVACPEGAAVTVPVAGSAEGGAAAPGAVMMARMDDGSWRVLPKTAVGGDGLTAGLPENAVVKVVDAAADFPDTAGEWYGEDGTADFVSARGILEGMPQADGGMRFDGGAGTTRAMFVTMLHRLESEPEAAGAQGFEDMDGSEWFAGAAAWGEASGVVNGYGDGSEFGGGDAVTREQMAVFMMRYAASLGMDTSARADLSRFPDAGDASPFAADALSWAVAEGLLCGHADGSGRLAPADGATRAEASAVIMRLVNGMYE